MFLKINELNPENPIDIEDDGSLAIAEVGAPKLEEPLFELKMP